MLLDVRFKDHKVKQTSVLQHELEATLMDTVAKREQAYVPRCSQFFWLSFAS